MSVQNLFIHTSFEIWYKNFSFKRKGEWHRGKTRPDISTNRIITGLISGFYCSTTTHCKLRRNDFWSWILILTHLHKFNFFEQPMKCKSKLKQPTGQTFFPTFPTEFSHFLQTWGGHSWVLNWKIQRKAWYSISRVDAMPFSLKNLLLNQNNTKNQKCISN